MEMGLCHAGPRTDPRHLNITQGCCNGGVATAAISQRHHSRVYCRVNRVCTIRELTLEVQMFAHANYLTADHTRTRISQITTI